MQELKKFLWYLLKIAISDIRIQLMLILIGRLFTFIGGNITLGIYFS